MHRVCTKRTVLTLLQKIRVRGLLLPCSDFACASAEGVKVRMQGLTQSGFGSVLSVRRGLSSSVYARPLHQQCKPCLIAYLDLLQVPLQFPGLFMLCTDLHNLHSTTVPAQLAIATSCGAAPHCVGYAARHPKALGERWFTDGVRCLDCTAPRFY